MKQYDLTEQDYRASIQAAHAINAISEILDSLAGLAGLYIDRGLTQEAADLLCFVMIHEETDYDTYEQADDLLIYLEARICPRVLYDAKQFAQEVSLEKVIEYIFAEDPI